jgi:EmrB/QacA subfamily drug resistance transporter
MSAPSLRDSSTPSNASRGAAGRNDDPLPRRRLVFAIVSLALFMASVDQTIVSTALNAIQHDLHARINWSGWTITIYSLGQIVAMPLAGRISDQYGRKKIFLGAVVLFTTTSLLCGFANSIYLLLPLRALQALGGGAFMPSASGIVSDQFGRDRDRALGMFTSIFPIGGIVGPIIGGVFVTYWSWRGIFLVNVPIGIVLLVLGSRFIPHSDRKVAAKTDLPGVLLLALLLITAMFGITYLGTGGRPIWDPVFLGCEAVAIVSIGLFIRHARRAAEPFIPIRLLHGKGFGVMNAINFLYGSAALGFGALVPLYAEERYHIHTLQAGTLLTARAVGMICVAGLAVMALRRTGYRLPMIVGFLTVGVGLLFMAMQPHGLSAYMWLAATAAITGIGMGLGMPAANNASMQLAPDQIAGISGLRGMFRQCGSIMSVSITTAILARSANPGIAQAHVLIAFAVIIAFIVPLIFLVPDHRGGW